MFCIMAKDAGCRNVLFDVEDGAEGEEVNIEAGVDTEVEPVKRAVDPGKPTDNQIEEHRMTHLPYRSWCRWCVLGRGRGLQHRARAGSLIPIVGIDYFFLTSAGVKLREELKMSNEEVEAARERGELVKCLVVRCYASKAVFGHVIPRKGLDEDGIVVDKILQDLEWLGHTRLIIKADNEPSIQALAHRSIELAKIELKDLDQVGKEDPVAYDSMTNGGTEIGVQLIKGLFRTVKLCLGQRIDKQVPVDHPMTAWMMEHASLLLNALVRGTDGLTAWKRIRGRAFGQQLVGLGENVLYKHPVKGPNHNPQGNVGAQGGEGVFVGYNRTNHTFMVSLEDGKLVAARSVTRRPERERWSAEALSRVRVMPTDGKVRIERERVRFQDGAADPSATAAAAPPRAAREMRINRDDLEEHGYDGECPQCKHIIKYGVSRRGQQHSARCRKRLVEAMSRPRTDAYESRTMTSASTDPWPSRWRPPTDRQRRPPSQEEKLPVRHLLIGHSLNVMEATARIRETRASRLVKSVTSTHTQQWTDGPVHVRQRKHKVSRAPWMSRLLRLIPPKHLDPTWVTLESPTRVTLGMPPTTSRWTSLATSGHHRA